MSSQVAPILPHGVGPPEVGKASPVLLRSDTATHRDDLVISASATRALWILVVTVLLVDAVLLALFATVYFGRDHEGSLLWTAMVNYTSSTGTEFINNYTVVVATGYATFSLIFAACGLRLIWLSLRHRGFRFGTATASPFDIQPASGVSSQSRLVCASSSLGYVLCLAPLHKICAWIERVRFAVGVHGPHFEFRLVVDEIAELAGQTIAAYSSSRSLINVYLNQTYGVVIFVNCVSPLVFHRIFRASQAKQRVACLVMDLVLDFVWGSLLPIWTYVPVVQLYQAGAMLTVSENENVVRTMDRVLIVSWAGFAISVMPYFNTMFNTVEILSTLSDAQCINNVRDHASCLHPCPPGQSPRSDTKAKRIAKWMHRMIAVYGCAVLLVSLAANEVFPIVHRQPQYGCFYRLNPWLVTKEACIVRVVNCAAAGIHGTAVELEQAFSHFDEETLAYLFITNCDNLEIPTNLARFHGILALEVADGFLVDWPASAAITQSNFGELHTLTLFNVDTHSILPGLVSYPISESIEGIIIDNMANAVNILNAVGTHWKNVRYLLVNSCNLTEVPHVVDTMHRLIALSLYDNQIEDVRDGWIAQLDLQLVLLSMDYNPQLTTLSDVVWRQASSIGSLAMTFTNLSAVPDWLPNVDHNNFVVFAYGSPLCDDSLGLMALASSAVQQLVSCG